MIEPLDFSKYDIAEFPQFPQDNYAEVLAEWHQINDFITEEFKADLVVYLIDYLSELGEESIYLPKVIKLVEIAMAEHFRDEVVDLCVRMLPLLIEDKL